MWIKTLPNNYHEQSSLYFNNVFLWQSNNVFVMDNHMAALWCWLQMCDAKKSYNFMHIDRHYDLLDCFKEEQLEQLKSNPKMSFEDYASQIRGDRQDMVLRFDNYIMVGFILHPRWFHTNIFLTHKIGSKETSWGHKNLAIQEDNPLFMETQIRQFVGEPSEFLYAFKWKDYKLPWIVNLDLDVFYTEDSRIQIFSEDYIRRIAEILQANLKKIAVLTIAVSPECLGGNGLFEKWDNGFRLLRIMSEKLECLKDLDNDMRKTENVR